MQGTARRLGPWLMAAGGYGVLALAITWPLALRVSSAFPHDPFDPSLNTWILWWNAHALPLTTRWWNAPMFWPARGALTLSEHLLGISVLTTPLQWLGAEPITAYNIALLISYPLSALAAHALAFAVTRRHDASALAGLIYGFSPYRTAQLPHIQMLWVFGVPLALLALHRYVETRARPWLVVFAAAWLVQALANGYLLLFFPVLLAGWVIWFGLRDTRGRAALLIVATWIVATLPLVPILWTYERTHAALNLERRADEIQAFSADLTAMVTTAPDMILWRGLSSAGQAEGQLFPGAGALLLVGVGVAAALIGRQRVSTRGRTASIVLGALTLVVIAIAISPLAVGPWRIGALGLSVSSPEKPLTVAAVCLVATLATTPMFAAAWRRHSAFAFYALGAAAMWAFSFGPRPRLHGVPVLFHGPYAALLNLPGFWSVRSPARFAVLAVLCLAVAAALAFTQLTAALDRRARAALTALCIIVVVIESWPTMTLVDPPPAIHALQRADLTGPVIELPIGYTDRDAAAQYRAISHGHPVVNGYSGYEPPSYRVLAPAIRLGDDDVIDELAAGEPLTIVLDRREQFDAVRQVVARHHAELVAEEGDWQIYRLRATARSTAAVDGTPLPVHAIEASAQRERAARMLDGNLRTEWNSGRAQAGGEVVTIDLGADRHITGVRMAFGPFYYDYPRRLTIACASDGGDWQTCYEGAVAATVLRGVLADARSAAATIPVDRDRVRRIRLTQTASDPVNGWSIAELSVLGR